MLHYTHTHTKKQSRYKIENKAGKGIKKVAKLLESEQFSGEGEERGALEFSLIAFSIIKHKQRIYLGTKIN